MGVRLQKLWQQWLLTADEVTTRAKQAMDGSRSVSDRPLKLRLDSLEPRILYSATPIDMAALSGGDEAGAMVATVELEEPSESSEFLSETTTTLVEASPREIVIIDGSVDEIEQLLDDLNSSGREMDVFVLDSARDGVDQITEILDGRTDVQSLHIVSHATEGAVRLGNIALSEPSLAGYAGQIASWQGSFSGDADILFYGCELAGDQAGQQLIESLSGLTGADVAASDDDTGHVSLGGDWDLEFATGSIESSIAFSADVQQDWSHLLAGSWYNATTGAAIGSATSSADLYIGSTGNDTEDGGSGNDFLRGMDGNDDLTGGVGDDMIFGGAGNDTLYGGNQNDILHGGIGDDVLYGGNQDDILISGGGSDTLDGGNADDLFLFTGSLDGDVVTVDGGTNTNTIDLSEFGVGAVSGGAGTLTVDLGGGESFTINYTNIATIIKAEDVVNHAPEADAGPNQSVATSSLVTLDASGSIDLDSDTLTYSWQQIGGTFVTLSSSTAESPTFTASGSADVLEFVVTVSDGTTSNIDTVTITVSANTSIGAVSDTDATADSVAENATVGATVGITAFADDVDVGDTVSYSLDDNAGGLFAVNASTGVVTTNGALDAETSTSHNITVRATSTDSSFSTKGFTISVTDVDEFDIGAISDTDGGADSVAENSSVGTTVGITASANDPDVTDNTTYSLDDSAGGLFAINSLTGVVTVNGGLDAETATSHNITVRATSSDSSFNTQVFNITVTDVNEFDIGVVSDTDAATNAVAENASIGATVGVTALANDQDSTDTVSYSLDDNAGGLFAINGVTGVVTVNGGLDAETASSHNITVRATSTDSSFNTQVFNISVTDVDEFDIGAISDSDGSADSVAENSTVGATVGITASANDPDVADNTTYSLDDNAGGLFAINATTGVVTVNGSLDSETSTSHNITVRADSDDASFSTQGYTITVTDLNEFDLGGVSDTDAAANTVAEDVAVGTAVGVTAFADDADVGDTVTYSLDNDAGGLFTIDAGTGIVKVNAALDAETTTSHNIIVRATSTDTTYNTQGFTITVTDVDEFVAGSISDTDSATDEVLEESSNGTVVGITAFADDADISDNITYSLDDDAGGRFAINGTSGVITVANTSLIDFETATSHNVIVRATSGDTSFSTLGFTVNILDVTEGSAGPISDTDAAADSVTESATIGATVGITAFSTDPDVLDNISYSLDDNAGGLFTINATSGVVTVNGALDAETATSHNIIVRATSDDTSFATKAFSVAVTDVNEFAIGVISDTNAAADSVAENSVIGTSVGITAFANDPDVDDGVTYSLDNDAGGLFVINTATGVVSVNGALDAETATSQNIVVRATSDDATFSTKGYTIAVTDVDEFNVGSISDTDAGGDSVAENSAVGTAVGVAAFADDADVTDNTTYSLDDDAGGLFAINAATGVVTVNGPLDYESSASHDIIIRATSDDASFSTRGLTIAVTDVSEAGVGPLSDTDGSPDSVAEGSPLGTSVGITALATDPDMGDDVTYSLDNSAGGLFAINATTGVVTVNGSLDAETSTSHNIVVRATSDDTTFTTLGFLISVADTDEFNVGQITDSDASANSVSESAGIGASVGISAFATDPDVSESVNYSLDDDAGGRFKINASTGEVTVNAALNYETTTSHDITVRATSDDTSFSTQGFSVAVTDANDAPQANPDSYVVLIGGTLDVPAAGLHANDFDEDGDPITATLVSTATGGTVNVNPDGSFTYTSGNVFFGVDSFSYKINDGSVDSNTATVLINVVAVTPPPSEPETESEPDPDPEPEAESEAEGEADADADAETDSESESDSESASSTSAVSNPSTTTAPSVGPSPIGVANPNASWQFGDTAISDLSELLVASLFGNSDAANRGDSTVDGNNQTTATSSRFLSMSFLEDSLEGALSQIDLVMMSQAGAMWDGLDEQRDAVDLRIQGDLIIVGTAGAAASTATVGLVAWALRGGFLLTGLMAQLPAWQAFDPLLIMQGLNSAPANETLEELMERRQQELSHGQPH